MRIHTSCLLSVVLLSILITAGSLQAQDASVLTNADQDAKLRSRIESLAALPPDAKRKISEDLQRESLEHFGFPAIKSVDDALAMNLKQIPEPQKRLIDQTTMHVVDGNLVPIAVIRNAIKQTKDQIYPDLQQVIQSASNAELLALAAKVGRIRYWDRNDLPSTATKEDNAGLAGTGFVIAPGLIATACHVLDYFVDRSTGNMSSSSWAKIDFSPEASVHQEFLIKGVKGVGRIRGQDFAILEVSAMSEDGKMPLPAPVIVDSESVTKFIGVVGYPDLTGANKACASPTSMTCDGSNKWFADFASENPRVIKIVSPGRKTGDFNPLGFPIFTYDAPTLGGQSGSPVIDLVTRKVIGLHYCCTGYAADPNQQSCALIRPMSTGEKASNEALAIKNVVVP